MQQARDAQQRVGAEDQGIEIVVVDAPVDHIDSFQPGGGAHVRVAVLDQQVAAFHQVGADLARQEHVLVESRVVDAGGQQRHGRIGPAPGGQFPQGPGEDESVVLDVAHPGKPVQEAVGRLGRLADGEHVRDARRDPQVVLEHAKTVVGPHQVGPADSHPHAVGRLESSHLQAVLGTVPHHVRRYHSVGDDAGLAVDVLQKAIESRESLFQAGREFAPFAGGHHPGNAVDGDDAFGFLIVAVDGEGDPLVGERSGYPLADGAQIGG